MKRLIFVLIIVLIPTDIFAIDEWTTKDTAFQAVFVLFQTVDWAQTREIVNNSEYYETNLILGKHPSKTEINIYSLSTTLLHTGIAYYLPKEYRRVWQCIWIGIEYHCIYHNHRIGIRIDF